MMPLEDVLLCMKKLDETAKYLPENTSFALDHEPMNHPDLERILRAASETKYIQNFHHGMTTGIGLMSRIDKDALMKAYLDCGYRSFGITIHGNAEHHDELVRRKGAYETAVAAAEYIKSCGGSVEVSLMSNRYFAEDADDISATLKMLQPDNIWFVSPLFTPHRNMMDFEPYRAILKTLEALRGYLSDWKQAEQEILESARAHTPAAVIENLKSTDLRELCAQEQNELYLTLHPDCRLYIGNTGVETRCLGDLRVLDPKETAAVICTLPGNREYTAFYEIAALPSNSDLIEALKTLPQDAVYCDTESVIYRGLAELGTKTLLIR